MARVVTGCRRPLAGPSGHRQEHLQHPEDQGHGPSTDIRSSTPIGTLAYLLGDYQRHRQDPSSHHPKSADALQCQNSSRKSCQLSWKTTALNGTKTAPVASVQVDGLVSRGRRCRLALKK